MNIKLTNDYATIPFYATDDSAGFDLSSVEHKIIDPNTHELINTGIAMSIPKGFVGLLFPRSGNAVKRSLNLINCVGVIDADFRDSVKVPLRNNQEEVQEIYRGDRIAQMVVVPYEKVKFHIVDDLDETERGFGGFGSTGLVGGKL
ncbi:MAG: dUTP diphosphatase [Bacillota bacterium]